MQANVKLFFVSQFGDLTVKQKCKRILFFLFLFIVLPIWIPSAVLFASIDFVVDFLRDKLYY